MDYLWIFISVFAALMQAVRTAAQKTLNQRMSNLGTTYVRSVFGFPVMLVFLAIVLWTYGGGWPKLSRILSSDADNPSSRATGTSQELADGASS